MADQVSYRDFVRELVQADTAFAASVGDAELEPSVAAMRRYEVFLDCFLWERVVNECFSKVEEAQKLVDAFASISLSMRAADLSVGTFQATYDSWRDDLLRAWEAQWDPAFRTRTGVKVPLASVFVARCGCVGLSSLIYADMLIRRRVASLRELFATLIRDNALSFD